MIDFLCFCFSQINIKLQQVIAPVSSSDSPPLPNEPVNKPAKPAEDAKKEPIPKSSFQSLSTVDVNKLNQDDFKRIRHAKKKYLKIF